QTGLKKSDRTSRATGVAGWSSQAWAGPAARAPAATRHPRITRGAQRNRALLPRRIMSAPAPARRRRGCCRAQSRGEFVELPDVVHREVPVSRHDIARDALQDQPLELAGIP